MSLNSDRLLVTEIDGSILSCSCMLCPQAIQFDHIASADSAA